MSGNVWLYDNQSPNSVGGDVMLRGANPVVIGGTAKVHRRRIPRRARRGRSRGRVIVAGWSQVAHVEQQSTFAGSVSGSSSITVAGATTGRASATATTHPTMRRATAPVLHLEVRAAHEPIATAAARPVVEARAQSQGRTQHTAMSRALIRRRAALAFLATQTEEVNE